MPLFVILSLTPSQCDRQTIDSYCTLYRPLITKKGDAAKLVSVPLAEKQIILGNEQLYRQYCGTQRVS